MAEIWQAAGATAGLQRPPMRNWSDNHSRVNHFHKLITLEEKKKKNYHGWKSEASVQSARARSVPREHHYLPTDGSHKLLSVCCCLLINLTLHKNPKIWRIQHSWPFHIHIKKCWKSKLSFLFWISHIRVLSCMMFINKLLVIDRRLNKIIIIFFRPIRCLCFLVGQFTHRLWLDLCILLKPWVNSNLL